MKLNEFPTGDIIKELQSRGYVTDLLWNRDDVQMNIDRINEDREFEGKDPIILDESQQDDILDMLNFDNVTSMINDDIYDSIMSEYVEDDEEEDEE